MFLEYTKKKLINKSIVEYLQVKNQDIKETTHRPRQRAIRGLHSNCMANVTTKEV